MKTGTRKSGAERREEIAQAVLRIIGERGLTTLTTATVADEVGVTSGALFRHFNSRDEMLDEAVTIALARIQETFPNPSLPPMERLLGLARNRIELFGSEPGIAWILRSDQAYLTLPAESVERLRSTVKRSKEFLLRAIRDGAKQGSIRSDIEPEILFITITGTIHTLIGMSGVHGVRPPSGIRPRSRRANDERALIGLECLIAPPT